MWPTKVDLNYYYFVLFIIILGHTDGLSDTHTHTQKKIKNNHFDKRALWASRGRCYSTLRTPLPSARAWTGFRLRWSLPSAVFFQQGCCCDRKNGRGEKMNRILILLHYQNYASLVMTNRLKLMTKQIQAPSVGSPCSIYNMSYPINTETLNT